MHDQEQIVTSAQAPSTPASVEIGMTSLEDGFPRAAGLQRQNTSLEGNGLRF
ncbi:hypothetical protein [Xanthomonas fragariae]|uniref:hypothetical protein n=1 Tax=Xanthomonas fragariae TaxID=48664 RepID=UPI0022AB406A|nr:hypothetical protein [Xanthomonas fragariae]WAT13825.1 hypothetical protein OZ429_11755 [Xanthomonas fragariae]